jgi:hypothetical protein
LPYADLPSFVLTTRGADFGALSTDLFPVERRAAMRRPTNIPTGIVKMNQTATTSNSICDLSAAFSGSSGRSCYPRRERTPNLRRLLHNRYRKCQRVDGRGFPRSGRYSTLDRPSWSFSDWSTWFGPVPVTDPIRTAYYVNGSLVLIAVAVCGRAIR